MKSKVKWFNNGKGYGFIKYEEQNDIFVHYTAISQTGYRTLNVNDVVEFKLVETPKGFQARDVTVIK